MDLKSRSKRIYVQIVMFDIKVCGREDEDRVAYADSTTWLVWWKSGLAGVEAEEVLFVFDPGTQAGVAAAP